MRVKDELRRVTVAVTTLVAVAGLCRFAPGQERGTRDECSPHSKLRSVALSDVRWTDGFWADRFTQAREVTIPTMWKYFQGETRSIGIDRDEASLVWENFLLAAQRKEGRYRPVPGSNWGDGDFYKWLEAVAAVFWITHDQELDDLMDQVIEVIGEAQENDGYLCTHMTLRKAKRFQEVRDHETYNMGHLMIAACLHHRATGKTSLLEIAERAADCLHAEFMRPDSHFIGYTSIMGLVELHRSTGKQKYLDLAVRFIDMHGTGPREPADLTGALSMYTDMRQDRRPLREESRAVGHAVWGTYLYCGAADVVAETGDASLHAALDRIWQDVYQKKCYITGGTSAFHHGLSPARDFVGEAFGSAYELPNRSAMCETCANIAAGMWNQRMLALKGEASCADAMERVLYNAALSGLGTDGTSYLYSNPLRWHGQDTPLIHGNSHTRWKHWKSYCCPPNLLRTIVRLGSWAYGVSDEGIWVHLYGSNTVETSLSDGSTISLSQETDYPWDGEVKISVLEAASKPFSLMLRIPNWASGAEVAVNGKTLEADIPSGAYFPIRRAWSEGDRVRLRLPMKARLTEANPAVEELRNQVAIERGPILYCLESHDLPDDADVSEIVIPGNAEFDAGFDVAWRATVLESRVYRRTQRDWGDQLYRAASSTPLQPIDVRFIPYYAWNNRGMCQMTVWMPVVWMVAEGNGSTLLFK